MSNINIDIEEELNLEDLIIFGEEQKIPIIIEYPKTNGETVTARALIKQLTLKEVKNVKRNNNLLELAVQVLKKALFKTNGDRFTIEELKLLPIGVIKEISDKILEISGVHEENKNLQDF